MRNVETWDVVACAGGRAWGLGWVVGRGDVGRVGVVGCGWMVGGKAWLERIRCHT